MKQLFQNLKTGNVFTNDIPLPNCSKNEVIIQTLKSLISPGTERMLLDFGKSSYLQKAKQQPEKVKQVLDKIKTDGLLPTIEVVFAKLDEPLPLGYCNVGRVIEIGSSVDEFKVGDLVVSNGAHSEVVCINKNLVCKIPEGVSLDEATFTVLSSIALQGIRLAKPTLGEQFVVIGLGIIGQITLELLKANGCKVIGVDLDYSKVEFAMKRGFNCFHLTEESQIEDLLQIWDKHFADGVLITASTKSNQPIENAAKLCRKKGRVVAVGAVGLDIPRNSFYEKELELQISCSYGPGRYDNLYEGQGIDYPLPHVRWTQNRNFQAILDLLKEKKIKFNDFITDKLSFENIESEYPKILNSRDTLGALINYGEDIVTSKTVKLPSSPKSSNGAGDIGLIGAGNFSKVVLAPAIKKAGASIHTIVSSKGVSSSNLGIKVNSSYSSTDTESVLKSKEIDTLFVTTQHDSHSYYVIEALKNNKNIFVEKPIATNLEQLKDIYNFHKSLEAPPHLMVGFNRRFSPLAKELKKFLSNSTAPISVIYNVNAGHIPEDHWVHDDKKGGGRIIGEGCHFIDLISYLTGNKVVSVSSIGLGNNKSNISNDTVTISLKYNDGSIGIINYFANGNKSYPKERITVFCQGQVYELENFKSLKTYGSGKNLSLLKQDKGHNSEVQEFLDSIKTNKPLIEFESILNTTLATFAHVESLSSKEEVKLDNIWSL